MPLHADFRQDFDGQDYRFKVEARESIENVKVKIRYRTGVPVDQQRLIHAGKQRQDDLYISDYNMLPDDTLHMVVRLRGGMQSSSSTAADLWPLLTGREKRYFLWQFLQSY